MTSSMQPLISYWAARPTANLYYDACIHTARLICVIMTSAALSCLPEKEKSTTLEHYSAAGGRGEGNRTEVNSPGKCLGCDDSRTYHITQGKDTGAAIIEVQKAAS